MKHNMVLLYDSLYAMVKKARKSCDIHCLETETFPRENHGFERKHVGFEAVKNRAL